MLVQADRIFVTTGPLSELVWSPRKGLALKCADSSSAEDKTSLWWSTESFNVITTDPENNANEENISNAVLPNKVLDSLQPVQDSNRNTSIHVNSPFRSVSDIVPSCPTMIHEQISTNKVFKVSSEEVGIPPEGNEPSIAEANNERYKSLGLTKVGGSSLGNSDIVGSAINAADKVSSQGHDNVKAAGLLSSIHVNLDMDHGQSNKEGLPEYAEVTGKEIVHALDVVEGLTIRCSTSGNAVSRLQCVDSARSGKVSDASEECLKHRMHPQLTYFHPLDSRKSYHCNSSQHGDLSFLKSFADCGNGAADNIVTKPSATGKIETPNVPFHYKNTGGTPSTKEDKRRMAKGKEKIAVDIVALETSYEKKSKVPYTPLEYTSGEGTSALKKDTSNMGKGKEKTGDFREDANMDTNKKVSHCSKEKTASDESVKSNKKAIAAGKRTWCFESKEASSKKLKMADESSSDGNLPRQDSSFLNWISGFAKALPPSVQLEMPMEVVPRNSHEKLPNSCFPMSVENCLNLPGNKMGFQSLIQTLHYPKLVMQQIITSNVTDLHKHILSTEFKIPNEQPVSANGSVFHVSTKLNMHQPIPLATLGLDQHMPEETLALDETNSSREFQGKKKHISLDDQGICNLVSSRSSIRIASMYHGTPEVRKPDPIHGSSVMMVGRRSEILRSFWVTRLCSKPSPLPLSSQVNQTVDQATGIQLDGGNDLLPCSQNDNVVSGGNRCPGNVGITLIEDQKVTMGNEELIAGNSFSSSKRMAMEISLDKRPKTKLNPILPSKRIKKLEPITSVFARRVDAFRHIKPSNIVSNVLYTASTCFFCGQRGHSIKDCSQVIGTEFESLQKNIHSYDGPTDVVCLCLRCFRLNHWAVECPYSSRKMGSPDGGLHVSANPERAVEQLVNEDSRRNERNHKEFPKNRAVQYIGTEPKLVKYLPGRFIGKNVVPSLIHGESKENQVTPANVFSKGKVFDEQSRIFEGIRGLQLSRTDVIRMIRAPISGFKPEGFFLRVRLGKQEEILEGSGYQVACISGAPQENSFGTAIHCIPVVVHGSKCLLDCRFVSNNEFSEDELAAWWSVISASGSKPPTEGQLMRKLKERKMVGI